jgi:hypothetical protein
MQNNIITLVLFALLLISCQDQQSAEHEPDYLAKGDSLSNQTFQKLSGILKGKIAEKGFPAAVEYCKLDAEKITNSFAEENVTISRTSLKPRNIQNTADPFELEILEYFQSRFNNGDSLKSIIKTDSIGNTHFFKPIMLQPLCMGCHGEPGKDIAEATFNMITQQYPKDLAIGYKDGDLRGLWHITFYK